MRPRSSCQSTSRAIVSRSSAPSSVNGVISGVIAPRTADGSAANAAHVLAPRLRRAPCLVLGAARLRQRVHAAERLAGLHALERPGLSPLLRERVVGDLLGERGRKHEHALAVADDHVAGHDERAGAGDRDVDLERDVGGQQ